MRSPRLLDGQLKLRHLVLIDALEEYRSMVRTAEHLHVTQPVISRGLQELEEILGVILFERTPRGLTPTVFGDAFTLHARNVIAQLGRAGTHIVELAEGRLGTVTVGTHLFGSNMLLPQAISAFKQTSAEATVVVNLGTPDDQFADLRAGRLDMIVGRLNPLAQPGQETTKPLYEEPVCLVTRQDHPLQGSPGVALPELIDHPWVIPVVGTWLRQELEELFARAGLGLPVNRVECTSYLTLHQLIVSTDTIGVLPNLVVTEDPRMRALARLSELRQTIGVTTVSGRALTPSAAELLRQLHKVGDHIKGLIRQLPLPPTLES